MSFFDDASLVMIPSGYKDQKVYSVKPIDGTGDLTFTRSNDTASRVNSSGLIEKVRQNQYYKSTAFTTSSLYATYNISPVSLGTYPVDSSSLGYSFSVTGYNQGFIVQLANDTNIRALSVYLKDWNAVDLYYTGSAPLSAGYTSEVVNGYTRYVIVIPAGANIIYFRPNSNYGTIATVYATAPQIEYGDFPTAYIVNDTTASAVSVGPVANLPRLDYSGGATCPSLLLEPQRTNIAVYSESFDNASWELGGAASISTNTSETLDPSGYYGADKLTANGSGQLYVRRNVYLGTAQTCSNSVYAKKANHRYVGLRNSGTTSQHDVFDFDTKTWTNNSGATLSYQELPNGWFRLMSVNTDAVNLNYYWSVIPAKNTSGEESQSVSNLSVYIWGAQAEQNASYPSSYINTLSAAVTRGQELCSKTGISSLLGQSEGTGFIEVDIQRSQDTRLPFLIGSANPATSTSEAYLYINGGNNLIFEFVAAGVPQCSISSGTATTGVQKLAFAYKNNDFVFYKNGVQVGVDTSGTVTSGFDRLYVGSYNANYHLNEPIKQALVFKTRLSNADLATLTTL